MVVVTSQSTLDSVRTALERLPLAAWFHHFGLLSFSAFEARLTDPPSARPFLVGAARDMALLAAHVRGVPRTRWLVAGTAATDAVLMRWASKSLGKDRFLVDRATTQHGTSLALAMTFGRTDASNATALLPVAVQLLYAALFDLDRSEALRYLLPEAIWSIAILDAMRDVNARLVAASDIRRTLDSQREQLVRIEARLEAFDPETFLRLIHRDTLGRVRDVRIEAERLGADLVQAAAEVEEGRLRRLARDAQPPLLQALIDRIVIHRTVASRQTQLSASVVRFSKTRIAVPDARAIDDGIDHTMGDLAGHLELSIEVIDGECSLIARTPDIVLRYSFTAVAL
jgi:hypothetical protein